MNVLFLSIADLEKSTYAREGNKNILKSEFGAKCDVVAICEELKKVERTDYGPRFWFKEGECKVGIIIGTFNKIVRKDAECLMKKFKEKKSNEKFYILLYANPYFQKKLFINVNNENGVIPVTKKVYEKFHELRLRSKGYFNERKSQLNQL